MRKIVLIGFWWLALALGLVSLVGCEKEAEKTEQTTDADNPLNNEELEDPDSGEISEATLNLILAIPSPQEAPKMLKDAGAAYDEKLLNPEDKVNKYRGTASQALNMGVYTANLSYASVYSKQQTAIRYYKAMSRLAEELGISSVFSKKLESRIKNNQENQDSLNVIFDDTFRDLNEQLKKTRQERILSLMFAGAWIESAYIATEQWVANPNPKIKAHILAQQSTLVDLLKLLETQKTAEGVGDIYNQLAAVEPKFGAADGQMVTDLTDAQVKEINAQLKKLRMNIVG